MSRRHTKPEPTQIRSALAKVLTAPSFAASARLSRLLRFIVEQTLSGRAHELKEYTLGVDVFDRGEKFAPKIDPIVRVSAGKLRQKLLEYYEGPGAEDEIRIVVPRGSYVPIFRLVGTKAPAMGYRRGAVVGLVLVGAGGVFWFAQSRSFGLRSSPPVVRVTGDAGFTGYPALSRDGKLLA